MDLADFLRIMGSAGFRIESCKAMHFWPARYALAFVPMPAWITTPAYKFGQSLMRLPGLRALGDYTAVAATAA